MYNSFIRRALRSAGAAMAVAGLAAGVLAAGTGGSGPAAAATPAPALHVAGNQLVTAAGAPVRLLGVDRSGTEYACAQGWGIFDGPSDSTSIAAIAGWDADAVRVPLNEDCWLGINGVNPSYSGANYRNAIVAYVGRLNAAGMTAVLDLHWGAPGTALATGQEQMPDADHSPAFWSSVGSTFASTPGVVFDLFNEPHDVSWSCWRNGCTLPDGTQAAGMQTLLNSLRASGATQPALVEGLNWGGDLSGWLADEPTDPAHDLAASAHLYNFSGCNTSTCWNQDIAPVAAAVPVVTGEIGDTDCASGFIDSYMTWADAHAVSYLAWAWDSGGGWSCSNGPVLLDSYDGTPNAYGAGFRSHLQVLAATAPPTTTASPTTTAPAGDSRVTASITASWGNGANVDLHVTNDGTVPIGTSGQPWRLTYTLPAATTVTTMWNAALVSQSGSAVVATAPSYTLSLAPGASIDVGWTQQGSVALPTNVAVFQPGATGLATTTEQTASWGNGANEAVSVTDPGPAPAAGWSLHFQLPAATTVTTMWNATLVSQAGGAVVATGPSWATTLAGGQTDTVGWTQQGSTAAPTGVSASAPASPAAIRAAVPTATRAVAPTATRAAAAGVRRAASPSPKRTPRRSAHRTGAARRASRSPAGTPARKS